MTVRTFSALTRALPLVLLLAVACGSDPVLTGAAAPGGGGVQSGDGSRPDAAAPGTSVASGPARDRGASPDKTSGDGKPCVGLQCQQVACPAGASTTVSGTVYDPAGKNPLYNIAVYVPNDAVQPLPSGATCDNCANLYTGSPIASALTDAAGKFRLENAPAGVDIPLVVQVGKWRRQFKLATVAACQDNPQADKLLRLPRNRSEGDIPNIAVSTGGSDTLECLLRRVGVDASEFVPGGSPQGRVQIFQGHSDKDSGDVSTAPNTAPPAPRSFAALWNSVDSLLRFDIVLLSCEGEETQHMNQQALHDYADMGGRVFASHYHYAWFNTGPYANENLATWKKGGNDIGKINAEIVTTLSSGQPFVKGQALQSWLGTVGALQNGKLPIEDAKHNADISAANMPSQTWIVADQEAKAPSAVQYFSFNTPTTPTVGADFAAGTCGRVVFSDLHVGAASGDEPKQPVPQSCADDELSPQEKALEFMLFDLSSCITPDTGTPTPPPIIAI